jgi:H+/Cl- antiporter ClcA
MSVNIIKTSLMPISQAVSWYMISYQPLYPSVFNISTFYCLWALYNKYLAGQNEELGHFSMGLLAVATFMKKKNFSIAANILVLANFLIPAYFVLSWSAKKVAQKVKKSDTDQAILWAHIFKAYFISNIFLWSTVLYKFYNNKLNSRPEED